MNDVYEVEKLKRSNEVSAITDIEKGSLFTDNRSPFVYVYCMQTNNSLYISAT